MLKNEPAKGVTPTETVNVPQTIPAVVYAERKVYGLRRGDVATSSPQVRCPTTAVSPQVRRYLNAALSKCGVVVVLTLSLL